MHNPYLQVSALANVLEGEMPDCPVTATKTTVQAHIYLVVQSTNCVIFFDQLSFGASLLLFCVDNASEREGTRTMTRLESCES